MYENIEHIVQGATFMQLGFMYTYHKEKMSKNIIMGFHKKDSDMS